MTYIQLHCSDGGNTINLLPIILILIGVEECTCCRLGVNIPKSN